MDKSQGTAGPGLGVADGREEGRVVAGEILEEGGVARIENKDRLDEATARRVAAREEEQLVERASLAVALLPAEVVKGSEVENPAGGAEQAGRVGDGVGRI